jgi:hypothetical protein
MTRNMLAIPKTNEIISAFDLAFKLNATNIGMTGSMQGESIEITPVKKEIRGRISI